MSTLCNHSTPGQLNLLRFSELIFLWVNSVRSLWVNSTCESTQLVVSQLLTCWVSLNQIPYLRYSDNSTTPAFVLLNPNSLKWLSHCIYLYHKSWYILHKVHSTSVIYMYFQILSVNITPSWCHAQVSYIVQREV